MFFFLAGPKREGRVVGAVGELNLSRLGNQLQTSFAGAGEVDATNQLQKKLSKGKRGQIDLCANPFRATLQKNYAATLDEFFSSPRLWIPVFVLSCLVSLISLWPLCPFHWFLDANQRLNFGLASHPLTIEHMPKK